MHRYKTHLHRNLIRLLVRLFDPIFTACCKSERPHLAGNPEAKPVKFGHNGKRPSHTMVLPYEHKEGIVDKTPEFSCLPETRAWLLLWKVTRDWSTGFATQWVEEMAAKWGERYGCIQRVLKQIDNLRAALQDEGDVKVDSNGGYSFWTFEVGITGLIWGWRVW